MSVEQIQALVDGLAARLGRAVLIDDRDLQLVAASQDFGDADPARVWSLLHRRTRPEDVRHDELARLAGPGYVAENPELELWQRLCVPVRCQGLLVGFVWVTDRFREIAAGQLADCERTAAEIGVLLRDRLLGAERDRALRQDLVERLLGGDAAAMRVAWDEAVDRGCWPTPARWPCCSSGASPALTSCLAPFSATLNGCPAIIPGCVC